MQAYAHTYRYVAISRDSKVKKHTRIQTYIQKHIDMHTYIQGNG